MPRLASAGATVHAGTIDTTTAIKVVATTTDEGSRCVAEIARLMHAAEQARGATCASRPRHRLYAHHARARRHDLHPADVRRCRFGMRSRSRSRASSSRARVASLARAACRSAAACSPHHGQHDALRAALQGQHVRARQDQDTHAGHPRRPPSATPIRQGSVAARGICRASTAALSKALVEAAQARASR